MNINNYYVYIYFDPRKPGHYTYDDISFLYEPFYVGKGKGDRWRPDGHLKTNPYLKNKINKIGIDNIKFCFIERIDNQQALNLEIRLIKLIGTKFIRTGPLINMTNGGEDGQKVFTQQHKDHLSIAATGRKMSQEAIEKTRQYLIGRKQPQEVVFKRNQSMREYYQKHDGPWKNKIGTNAPFFGKRHSLKTKEQISRNKISYYSTNNSIKTKNTLSNKTKDWWNENKDNEAGRTIIKKRNLKIAKLIQEQVDKIRELYNNKIFNQSQLAKQFSISPSVVCEIVNYKAWKI